MLCDFKKTQPIAYKILKNTLEREDISHAYIFETQNYANIEELVNSFVSEIICEDVNKKEHDIDSCFVCSSIKNNTYPELKLIETEGLQIKKNEMIDLQVAFKTKPIFGKKMVYIIKEAEKMNAHASNAILKFLEEPEPNIIAILIVKNRYQLMETILSRCQLISFLKEKEKNENPVILISELLEKNITEEELEKFKEKIGQAVKYISYVDEKKLSGITFSNKHFGQYFKERIEVVESFKIMNLFLSECLLYKTNSDTNLFINYEKELINLANNNTMNSLAQKIEILQECINRLYSNANTNLVLDYLCINFWRII